MSEYIHKSRNVTVFLYHWVFPAKDRRVVTDGEVDQVLKAVCFGIAERYQVKFLEIGTDKDHVHFLRSVGANVRRKDAGEDCEEFDGAREIQAVSAGEASVVGRGILDGWVFFQHVRKARR